MCRSRNITGGLEFVALVKNLNMGPPARCADVLCRCGHACGKGAALIQKAGGGTQGKEIKMINRQDIQIRDPFILTDGGKYYLYGTTDKNCWSDEATGFDSYCSTDLEHWEGPFEAFRPEEDFWADRNFWAPEVYAYQGRYYMFASFKKEGVCRGTQVLVSDRPEGKFVPYSDGCITPSDWECLDGTLYIDDQRKPWMVFCHEWTQVADGEMCAVALKEDLSQAVGNPVTLFRASQASWTRGAETEHVINGQKKKVFVTDGPFLYRAGDGSLLMLWSSGGEEGYAIGLAKSRNGEVTGPWEHQKELLFAKNGGHGMLFKDFSGQLFVTLHAPNQTPYERPCFFKVREQNGTLVLQK